ncbi:hypothetical protein ZIOFF_041849 [Zingiber officinale]|uniref:Malectin-like domain-containing protein n=1 Tax=Zingiber officinale TaxID=94328 RepID=A0A8J5G8B7_ZINOF|nr:hypothetical protein ZIOFF_041849 [Zingiber officinale]
MKNPVVLPNCALVCASLIILSVAPAILAADNDSAILLSCGASQPGSDLDGRDWTPDSDFNFSLPLSGHSVKATQQGSSVPRVPYLTARVFTSPFSYNFPLAVGGRVFLRLYFYPSNYDNDNYTSGDAFFSVTAGTYTLLHNFSASLVANNLNYDYFTREFSLNVSTGVLNLTFSPSPAHNNSYAFINGVEIVPIPDIFNSGNAVLINTDGYAYPILKEIHPESAIETVYRLNVGGQAIAPPIGEFSRFWEDDTLYLFGASSGVTFSKDTNVSIRYAPDVPSYIAPTEVYATARSMGPDASMNLQYNLTWILQVDAGFSYLVRFHFCEIQYPITTRKQRVFEIFINNQTAEESADVIAWSGGIGVATFRDYMVSTTGSGQMDMWVALHPQVDSRPHYYDAILNGLEVFKLQNSSNSLAGFNPEPRDQTFDNPDGYYFTDSISLHISDSTDSVALDVVEDAEMDKAVEFEEEQDARKCTAGLLKFEETLEFSPVFRENAELKSEAVDFWNLPAAFQQMISGISKEEDGNVAIAIDSVIYAQFEYASF